MHSYKGSIEQTANYAFLYILNYIGIGISEEEVLSFPHFSNLIRAETFLRRRVKAIKPVKDSRAIDTWLSRGQHLIAYTINWNMNLHQGYTQFFNGHEKVFFIIVEDLGDLWKLKLSFGDEYGDGGYVYMNKNNFEYLSLIRRIVP